MNAGRVDEAGPLHEIIPALAQGHGGIPRCAGAATYTPKNSPRTTMTLQAMFGPLPSSRRVRRPVGLADNLHGLAYAAQRLRPFHFQRDPPVIPYRRQRLGSLCMVDGPVRAGFSRYGSLAW